MSASVGSKAVDKELARAVWPRLKAYGFVERASRTAWRRTSGTDLIEVSSVGAGYEAVGCTSFSLTVRAGHLPEYLPVLPRTPQKAGLVRPHYWHTPLVVTLTKTLDQPWFEPFAQPPKVPGSRAAQLHREGLMQMLRTDVHDRPDIWFIKEDGSNLEAVVSDVVDVLLRDALPFLDQVHEPANVIQMVNESVFKTRPGSPAAYNIVRAARDWLANGEG